MDKTYVKILNAHGVEEALLGLSLSYNQEPQKMPKVARRLAGKGKGHDKFLEFIVYWLDIKAPRHWWQQFDAYRLRSEQSESTMHTLLKKPLTQDDFNSHVIPEYLDHLNLLIQNKNLIKLKDDIPESFLQRRIVRMDLKALLNVVKQRKEHKNPFWEEFCSIITNSEIWKIIFGEKNES